MSKPAVDYDLDFYSWTIRNAELIRRGEFDLIDAEHVAEEIEDMGKAWQFQPQRRGSSWETSLAVHRRAVAKLLRENPSSKPTIPAEIEDAYPTARLLAGEETGLGVIAFPAACPYSAEQVVKFRVLPRIVPLYWGACPRSPISLPESLMNSIPRPFPTPITDSPDRCSMWR